MFWVIPGGGGAAGAEGAAVSELGIDTARCAKALPPARLNSRLAPAQTRNLFMTPRYLECYCLAMLAASSAMARYWLTEARGGGPGDSGSTIPCALAKTALKRVKVSCDLASGCAAVRSPSCWSTYSR